MKHTKLLPRTMTKKRIPAMQEDTTRGASPSSAFKPAEYKTNATQGHRTGRCITIDKNYMTNTLFRSQDELILHDDELRLCYFEYLNLKRICKMNRTLQVLLTALFSTPRPFSLKKNAPLIVLWDK